MLKQQLDCAANCHTTLPYLVARPLLPGGEPHQDEVRKGVADRIAGVTDWSSATPWFTKSEKIARWSLGSEAVTDAAALVADDVARGRALSSESVRALDMMWAQQRPDGAWDWFGFGMEPWETNDDCGAALAATMVAELPVEARARAHKGISTSWPPSSAAGSATPLTPSAFTRRRTSSGRRLAGRSFWTIASGVPCPTRSPASSGPMAAGASPRGAVETSPIRTAPPTGTRRRSRRSPCASASSRRRAWTEASRG